MRWIYCAVTFIFTITSVYSQNISGKWVGKAYQGKGELCTECDFELNLNQLTNITGMSHHFQKDSADISMELFGYFDKDKVIHLQEERSNKEHIWIYVDTIFACLKNYILKYQVISGKEYLIGSGTGESVSNGAACIPAKFVFSRDIDAVKYYVSVSGDTTVNLVIESALPVAELTSRFNNTTVKKAIEIEVYHRNLQLRLVDYLKVDQDTVSVYLNRKILTKDIEISKKAVKINFNLDERMPVNEILLFAENLGRIPPNTSLLEIVDGSQVHSIRIESDKQKTAAIYLRYKKNPE